jgi:GNAT superfamily N-acetyltransferase
MSFTIDRLHAGARSIIASHFLALSVRDRYSRFAISAPPQLVAKYVDGIDFVRDAVLGVHQTTVRLEEPGALIGVAHTAFEGDVAEFGVSVLPAHRGQGLGSALLDRAVALARRRGMRRLWMQFLAHNVPIMRIARKVGMRVVPHGVPRARISTCPAGSRAKQRNAIRVDVKSRAATGSVARNEPAVERHASRSSCAARDALTASSTSIFAAEPARRPTPPEGTSGSRSFTARRRKAFRHAPGGRRGASRSS